MYISEETALVYSEMHGLKNVHALPPRYNFVRNSEMQCAKKQLQETNLSYTA